MLVPERTEFPDWIRKQLPETIDSISRPAIPLMNFSLDYSEWHLFQLQTLFDIKKEKRLTKVNQSTGKTPYIGAIEYNNGVSSYIGQEPIHLGGTISVTYNGSVAEAFYQPVPFWATDDVNVLYPKFKLTPAIALFIATLIRKKSTDLTTEESGTWNA